MRFWQKIFLISLAVLTVAVNTIAYLLIGNNHQLNLSLIHISEPTRP